MLKERFAKVGAWLYRHRIAVIGFWVAAVIVASLGAARIASVLAGGTGGIAGSQSERVEQILATEFDNPYAQVLVLVARSETQTIDDPAFRTFLADTLTALRAHPEVSDVTSYPEADDVRLISDDRRETFAFVGLKARDVRGAEKAVPAVREALQTAGLAARAADPTFAWHVTGRGALTYDINQFSTEDTSKAEARSMPLTILVLLLAFGTLMAAGIPLVMGAFAIVLTQGLLFLVAGKIELTAFAQSVSTMLGLAMGIDYSLLMVNRFRNALARGLDTPAAVEETVSTAGVAVLFSGLTVLIGFAGLVATPILDTRSIGWGGFIVVIGAVTLALTLLPAILGVLGPRVDSPRWFRLPTLVSQQASWRRWGQRIMRRPIPFGLTALVLLVALAWPATTIKLGFPSGQWLPERLEFQQGYDALMKMDKGGVIAPVHLVLDTDQDALSLKTLPALMAYSRELAADPRVAEVAGPVNLRKGMSAAEYVLLYRNLDAAMQQYPLLGNLFLSRDRRSTYMYLTLSDDVDFEETKRLARELETKAPEGFRVLVGGQASFYNDFDAAMLGVYPWVIGFVLLATLVMMAAAFRSVLVPVKAVLMNLLSVGAGYGAVVAVFQYGWGAGIFGLDAPSGAIPLSIPLMLFCIIFGLSMDYEVFLLHRIKEVYDDTGDNTHATVEGLADTAGIITSAALVMVVVFGAFAWAEMVIVQMLGLGLAVAVLVDATIIRILLVPALMRLAGDWNWRGFGKGGRHVA
jgi:RND superfamily putative drug exporter